MFRCNYTTKSPFITNFAKMQNFFPCFWAAMELLTLFFRPKKVA